MGFTLEDFFDHDSYAFDGLAAGDALARSIAHTAAAFGDDLVVAIFAASKCRVERSEDNDRISYTVRVATPPAPFAVYLRDDAEPNVLGRVKRYGGPLLEDVWRIVIGAAIDFEPGWESRLIEDYFRSDPSPRESTDAETLSRLLKLPTLGDRSSHGV